MGANTKIEWCDHTFNPWEGCTKVSPGCDNCYAHDRNARFSGGQAINWGPGAPRRRTSNRNWAQPLQWNAEAERLGVRYRVFCASLADVFDNEVPTYWRWGLFHLIDKTPHLDWMLLTKRIGNARAMLNEAASAVMGDFVGALAWDAAPWPNVYIGATIVNQAEADRDIPKLLAVPAEKRFLSMEPLLGPVSFENLWVDHHDPAMHENMLEALDWVIVGGESGPNARPMHPDWVRSLRDQCEAAGVPFMFKQWGIWSPIAWFDGPDDDADNGEDFFDLDRTEHIFLANDGRTWDTLGGRLMYPPLPLGHWCLMGKVGKKAAGRLLDGHTWDGFPHGPSN